MKGDASKPVIMKKYEDGISLDCLKRLSNQPSSAVTSP